MSGSTPISFAIAQRLFKLLELLDDDDDRLAEPAAEHRGPDEGAVLVAVADDEALGVLVHRERGDQLRFAARFETEMKLRAGVDDLFDHFAQLVDLDRKDAAILVAITELLHRGLKGAVDRLDPVAQQVLKPDDERKTEAALARFVDHLEHVNRAAGILQWLRHDVPGAVDREVAAAPAVDIVSRDGGVNIPVVLCHRGAV